MAVASTKMMSEKQLTLGACLPELLIAYGIDTVFGIPGVHTVEMYRGLHESSIRHVTPRHEQGAGFMADGYARVSGKPAACLIISGPGMTNIMTAMGQAYADSIPMLVISSVIARDNMGSGEGWLHELTDQNAIVSGVAAFSRTIYSFSELQEAFSDAFKVFNAERPRPVHIEIPIDVLELPVPQKLITKPNYISSPKADQPAMEQALSMLTNAKAPVILAGGGAKRANLTALAELLDAPVISTTNARGGLPLRHPLSIPISASFQATRDLISSSDLVLALGTEMGPTDYDMFESGKMVIDGSLIRVDLDPCQLNRNFDCELAICADAATVVEQLVSELPLQPSRNGKERTKIACTRGATFSEDVKTNLALLDEVRDTLPYAPIIGDSTQLVYAAMMGFEAGPSGFFCSATGFGTLGFGLPAAIGASFVTDGCVVGIIGDGGLQFCLGEMASAREENAHLILIVHDNKGYGEIKSYMQHKGLIPMGVDIFTPDFVAIAKAFDWAVEQPSVSDFKASLLRAAANKGPTMIYLPDDVRTDFRQLLN